MQSNYIPVHKLILLYIAKQAPGIRRSRLRDAALASLSMDYLDMTRALEELTMSGLLRIAACQEKSLLDAQDREVEHCDLTEKGQRTLAALENQIPVSTRRFLAAYLDETLSQRRAADTLTSVVEVTSDGRYRLTCRQLGGEDGSLSFTVLFPTEAMARKAGLTWREKPASVFSALIESLLGEGEKTP
ncbi:MAG: DUF4364 family protein [Clostridiaceae bacterium]|nr:DUF4364 family protein [Clostridiaceae bacterium]